MARRPRRSPHTCPACAAEARGIPYEEWMDGHLAEMDDRIRRGAYTFTGVFGNGCPPWVYSTGLMDTFLHPELMVVGAPFEFAYVLLNSWAALIKAGVYPKSGGQIDERAGFPAKFIEVAERHCLPTSSQFADWHRYHDFIGCASFPLKVLQLVYPDGDGRFPGDDGVDPKVADHQRLFDR